MIFSKIYCDRPQLFLPIRFHRGVNVVLARVRDRKDETKDSHNLGKTLLIDLLDFCLLADVRREFFLKRHSERFAGLSFLLEIELDEGAYVTVHRSVDESSKISFKRHDKPDADFSRAPDDEWDHAKMPFERAILWLDGVLNLEANKPWSYRKGCGYFMRKQDDFRDVFQLDRFSRGKDRDWKPYVAHLLGFDSAVVSTKYSLDDRVQILDGQYQQLRGSAGVTERDYDRLKGQIEIKEDEIKEKQRRLDQFDFHEREAGLATELVDEIEGRLAELNTELYNLRFDLEQAETGARTEIHFDVTEVQTVFEEAQLYFPADLKRGYEELTEFNRRIIEERRVHLAARITELRGHLEDATAEHAALSSKRQQYLAVLNERDSVRKFKYLQASLDKDRANLALLQERFRRVQQMLELRAAISTAQTELQVASDRIGEMVRSGSLRYTSIRLGFAKLLQEVLRRRAELYVKQNDGGNIEFRAEFQEADREDSFTSESEGTTYKKFLCMAFDLAAVVAYSNDRFYHFIYHDGAFETEDNRRKVQWLNAVRRSCSEHRLQYILTTIEDDLPRDEKDDPILFPPEEIVRELHDLGDEGRLFRMPGF